MPVARGGTHGQSCTAHEQDLVGSYMKILGTGVDHAISPTVAKAEGGASMAFHAPAQIKLLLGNKPNRAIHHLLSPNFSSRSLVASTSFLHPSGSALASAIFATGTDVLPFPEVATWGWSRAPIRIPTVLLVSVEKAPPSRMAGGFANGTAATGGDHCSCVCICICICWYPPIPTPVPYNFERFFFSLRCRRRGDSFLENALELVSELPPVMPWPSLLSNPTFARGPGLSAPSAQ